MFLQSSAKTLAGEGSIARLEIKLNNTSLKSKTFARNAGACQSLDRHLPLRHAHQSCLGFS